MCNDYEQHVKRQDYVRMMRALELGIPTQQSELDLSEADDIRINQMGPVMRATANDNEIELAPMNFGLPSDQPKRGPVFNFSSEGRGFSKTNRCLIAASGFFEFMWTFIDYAIWKGRRCALSGYEGNREPSTRTPRLVALQHDEQRYHQHHID